MEERTQFYANYEKNLTEVLLKQCTSLGWLNGQLLEVEELDEKWNEVAPEYMVDAVPQIAEYPLVTIAWPGYLGMALAMFWDKQWDHYNEIANLYLHCRNERGFDHMDEYILEEVLELEPSSQGYASTEDAMRTLSTTALTMIRREEIEPQSVEAFHIYARTVKVLFKIGVALQLRRLGYKYEKVDLPKGKFMN